MREPPGLGLSKFEQLSLLRKDFLGYLLDAAKLGHPIVRLEPGAKIDMILDPELVDEVLVGQARLFEKSAMTRRMVGKFLGQGLVLSEGDHHRRQRSLVSPAFRARTLPQYVPSIESLTREMIQSWRVGDEIQLDRELSRLAMRIVVRTLFGYASSSEPDVSDAMSVFADAIAGRFRGIPWPDWVPTRANRLQRSAVRAVDAAINEIIEHRRKNERDDLVSWLLRAQDEAGGRMDAKQVRDELATLYFAGHETTAQLLTWAAYLLAEHPEVLGRVRAEAEATRSVVEGTTPELDAVIEETMRLYPPAWVFDRSPTQDVEIGGFTLKKGSTIYVSPYVLHRDARAFEDPHAFRPERWFVGRDRLASAGESALPARDQLTRERPRCYIPFGRGPRQCIGAQFAHLEARLVLFELVKGADWSIVPGQKIEPAPAATLRPKDGLRVQVIRANGP